MEKKYYKVPVWTKPVKRVAPTKKQKRQKHLSDEDKRQIEQMELLLKTKRAAIKSLQRDVAQLQRDIKSLKYKHLGHKSIKLYVLRCEHSCWYVGSSWNPETRFRRHAKGKGAVWTKLHPPIEIVKLIDTKTDKDYEVAPMEDALTLEYAEMIGKQFVRGGGYCQMKPKWPF